MVENGGCIACGKCCEYVQFQVFDDSFDYERWLNLRGFELVRDGTRLWARIELPCILLTEDGKCAMWDKRPLVCQNWFCADAQSRDPDW